MTAPSPPAKTGGVMAKPTDQTKEKNGRQGEGGGRPSKIVKLDIPTPTGYSKLSLAKVKELAKRGWTDVEMAKFFGVHPSTWNEWKAKHAKFREALKEWKDGANERVVRSLYERAVGYTFVEAKVFHAEGKTTIVEVLRHVPPDVKAQQYWLNNRDRENWRHHQYIEHEGDMGALTVIHTNVPAQPTDGRQKNGK